MSIGQVRIGMASTEVRKRYAVLYTGFWQAECINQEGSSIGAGNAIEAIEENREISYMVIQEFLDEREVENGLEQSDVISNRVNDGDFSGAVCKFSYFGKV